MLNGIFDGISGDARRDMGLPQSNEDLPRFSIPLPSRPDLREPLQAVLEIIRASCPKGADITTALAGDNTQILVFTDLMMNRMAGTDTAAAHANAPGRSFLCLRESALLDREQHFQLIRQIAHEGTHVEQRQKFPVEFGNRRHPHYVTNTLAFEKEAFANAVEVNLAIALLEAQGMAQASGRAVPLRETNMVRDWLNAEPDEAAAILSAFENDFSRTRSLPSATNAARAATLAYFERHHEEGYRQKAMTEARQAREQIPG